jgi:hypothetical protein
VGLSKKSKPECIGQERLALLRVFELAQPSRFDRSILRDRFSPIMRSGGLK